MPGNKYVRITIDDEQLDLGVVEELPLAISYSLEDRDNFQRKNPSKALNVVVPANPTNDKIANTFHNPGIEDLTENERYKNNRRAVIEANGQELLVGKSFLAEGTEDDRPLTYEFNFYGNNADWLIDLKETTLFDFLKHYTFIFTKSLIESSWSFDGTNPNMPYVFAPVRYGDKMDTMKVNDLDIEDYNMKPEYMRPAISKYWIIYNAFKSLGYKIQSEFFDTPYFRRQVMPWTWGNFLSSQGTELDKLDFLAKSTQQHRKSGDFTGIWDLQVTNDSVNGAFDNNNVYSYNVATKEMTWVYNAAFNFGLISPTFHLSIFVDALVTENSNLSMRTQWFRNGVRVNHGNYNGDGTLILSMQAPDLGGRRFYGQVEDWATINVNPGDIITCKIYLHIFDSNLGIGRINAEVDAFELDYIRIPLGGTINFSNYPNLKKYKFLEFLGGVIDEFNLSMQTDPVNKVVYFEPEHPYSLIHDQSTKAGGYFNGNWLDWSQKQDLSKRSVNLLFNEYERELSFKYKEDNNDGTYKIVQARNGNTPALAKYVFPDRFKAGKKEIENRFFSTVMHYDVMQWKGVKIGDAGAHPQMICLIPENISNTSRDEAANLFEPKSAYYKGLVNDWGWVFDGESKQNFPFMFAVNYRDGGENDPILSYCDELIGPPNSQVSGIGLVRRFYLQRLEIMKEGKWYKTWFYLNNNDIANFLHREYIICKGQRWELIEINNYEPLKEQSTEVLLRKWSPIKDA